MRFTMLLKSVSTAVLALLFAVACTSKNAPPVTEPVTEVDSDGDGVPDSRDKCPNTPAGAVVDQDGCELDSDGDGVVDRLDKCPNTPAGARVDENGCEIIAELGMAHFAFDKAELNDEGRMELDESAKTLMSNPNVRIEVAGHTDSVGSDSYNMSLGERRAKVVADYLVSKGVGADRLEPRSYGESRPVAANSTKEGRAQNRRTELVVIGQ